ncbi:hypothetical protein Rt10032_c10g4328 [Rhodotorula toruloides]|uniref:Proteophosphoglycan ppg4 n=1 Tax=Rhodotorula toruloides TaxID=5286 RepID=A0A511KIW4_RHOTO|nr:hypothetical protein Rt10032_c10g4328 [Rhodotorula toruloides]
MRDRTNKPSKRYRDLFGEFWGRPCGRLLNGVAYCALSVDRDDLDRPLYIREDYERAWTVLQDTKKVGLSRGLVWEGQPGIGKSVGLRYLLLRSFKTCTPVIYCPNIAKPVMIFCNDGIFAIPQDEFDHFKYLDYKKQTVGVILVVDLVHKYELRDIMTVTVDLHEKKGDPEIIHLDSYQRPQTLNTVNIASASSTGAPPPLSPSSTTTILPSVPSTTDDSGTTPLPSSIVGTPSVAAQDGRDEPESDKSDESDAEEEEPSTPFIQLHDYVDAYWSAWSAKRNVWHPIDVFRMAGPSLRAPLDGILRRTGDFCLDYFGGPVQEIPVKTLAEFYRIVANRQSPGTSNSPSSGVLQLRPDAQMTQFHSFFEKPTTKEPSSALVPPSRFIIPTLWLSQVLVAAIAEAEADLVKGLFPLFK